MKKQNEKIKDKQGLKKCRKKEKAITLIALVVTIIVLLILAGVSIAMLTGEGGILENAKQARYKTGRENLIESVQMEILENMTTNEGKLSTEKLHDILSKYFSNVPDLTEDKWTNFPEGFPTLKSIDGEYDIEIGELYSGKLGTTTEEEKYLKQGEKAETTTKNNYKDENDELATIPKGFHVSTEEGEQNVEDGLVIIDDDGNEFVWIPCTTTQYENAKNAVMTEGWTCNNEYKDNGDTSGTSGNGTGNGLGWRDDYTDTDNSKIKENYTGYDVTKGWENNQTTVAKTSIGTYEGFYIARYEAGIPKEASNFYVTDLDLGYKNVEGNFITVQAGNDGLKVRGSYNDSTDIKDLKPVSKKGVQVWNYITQPNSKMIAENMYKGNNDVGSYLVDSQAWNHICKNIFEGNKEGKSIKDSSSWGNYHDNTAPNYSSINGLWAYHSHDTSWHMATQYTKGQVTIQNTGNNHIELATGSSNDFKLYNIYDMAGNMWEWTTGHNIKNNQIFVNLRGGSEMDKGQNVSVVHANSVNGVVHYGVHVSFRVVLYVK